jgi:hypothetical protein
MGRSVVWQFAVSCGQTRDLLAAPCRSGLPSCFACTSMRHSLGHGLLARFDEALLKEALRNRGTPRMPDACFTAGTLGAGSASAD